MRYKYKGFGAWAIFSDLWGLMDFLYFSIDVSSVVFVEWGGEFIVKPVKIEGFAIGPLRKAQENNDEKVGFGR